MASDKKPFAMVRTFEDQDGYIPETGWQTLLIGGVEVELSDMADLAEADRIAEEINAAVEARETKLRGQLRYIRDAADKVCAHWFQARELPISLFINQLDRALAELAGEELDFVTGDLACALAWDVGALRAKFEDTWAVLFDALADERRLTPEVLSLMEALGVTPKPGPSTVRLLPAIAEEAIAQHEQAVETAIRQLRAFGLPFDRIEMGSPPEGVLRMTMLRGGADRLFIETALRNGRISTTSYRPPPAMVLTGVR